MDFCERKRQKAVARRRTLFLKTFRFAAPSSSCCSPGVWPLTSPAQTPASEAQQGKRGIKEPETLPGGQKHFFWRKLKVCFPQNLKKIQSESHLGWLSTMIFSKMRENVLSDLSLLLLLLLFSQKVCSFS